MLEELRKLLGWDGLQELARRLGGRRIYIPRDSEVAEIRMALGARSAAFHQLWAGNRVEVPPYQTVLQERQRRATRDYARELLRAGGSIREVAQRTGLSRRTVRGMRRGMR